MSSLLQTFRILFESDAEDVEKGAKAAGKAIDDLEDKIKDTDGTTKQLGSSFLGLTRSAQTAIAGIISFGAISAGLINVAQQTDDIGKFSQALGLNVSQVSAWSEAVIRFGGSAQSFQSSLGGLTLQLSDFALTGSGPAIEVFARLGISAFDSAGRIRSAFDILPELADTFQSLTQADAVNFGQKLGLDQGTILLLQQGRREIDSLIRRQTELGTVTEEDARLSAEFNKSWADFSQVISDAGRSAGIFFFPMLTKAFEAVEDLIKLLRDNKDLVTGFFLGMAGAITAFLIPALLRSLVALGPYLLLAAAVIAIGVAFALVYEDIKAFREGNDSLIGEIIKKYPRVGDAVKAVGESFNALKKTALDVFEDIKKIPSDPEEAFKGLSKNSQMALSLSVRQP